MEDFLRAVNALERVPYSDLRNLRNYIVDYYHPGESELLAASGLIKNTIIDAGHCEEDSGLMYGLSSIGETMHKYGLCELEFKYNGSGTEVRMDTISAEEINDIANEILH